MRNDTNGPETASAVTPAPSIVAAEGHGLATAVGAGTPGGERDQIFAHPRERIADFDFGEQTAVVFDDMLDRSVPFYQEIQRMVAELAVDFAVDGSAIYDLGCSTATTFLRIDRGLPPETQVRFIGVDSSQDMLGIAAHKLSEAGFRHAYELRHADLNSPIDIHNASVVLMVLTLQFVRPLYRERLVQSIYDGMDENGCLILVEKVLGENSTFNRLFINHYYELKRRNGYTQLEIAQKREALENVLIPYRLEENKELLRGRGFRHVDVFFKWYNFCAMIAMK
jgi:tRNA (cmo5U34)-methyltransferase